MSKSQRYNSVASTLDSKFSSQFIMDVIMAVDVKANETNDTRSDNVEVVNIKGTRPSLRQFLATESPLNMMKKAF